MKTFLAGFGILATASVANAAISTTVLDNTTNTDDAVVHVSNAFAEPSTFSYIGLFQGANMQVLLRFDLATLPANSVVNSATLRIRQIDNQNEDNGGQPLDVSAYAVLKDWVRTEVSYTNYKAGNAWATAGLGAGTDREVAAAGTATFTAPTAFQDFDITTQYQQWYSGAESNNGLLLIPNSPQGYIRLPEASNANHAGYMELVVDYTPVPEPASIGALCLAGLLLARRRIV